MGAAKSCCSKRVDDKLMVTKMDLSHCGCLEVPHVVFNAERHIETLVLASNQLTSLPPQLFHCQEMKHLNLNDNCLNSIPPAIGSFQNLVSLKLDKNNLQELPDNLKMCKKLKRLSLNNNPWKQIPNIVTQIITLEELYINDCELNFLPASVGRLSKLKILELRNNNLCGLPLSMTRLELLFRLDISDNEFNEFPPCIPKLKSLKELLIDNNDIDEIIDVKNLVNLEHLDASYNHSSNVSETLGFCINLNMLNLSFNYLEQLPSSLGNITNLQTLQLEMNELTEIPKSIGKLSHLEELNLCNNKLYSLPSTIGLLRNLRNLNVSRNIIEEFPPEIGSCTRLAIINAAYNRLQVLPSEIGYLNNLKVLDLVGNFLMYLPITIINLRGIRAIWLSANQNVPLIPFTEDINIASGERFLTNIALPQLGEIPLLNSEEVEKKMSSNDKSSSWNKKIRFAEDEDLLPGKLHRTPTPFPKELRSPNKKLQRMEEPKPSDNYVNVIDGKIHEQEIPLLQPPSPVTKTCAGLNFPEICETQIREANIRRNNKEGNFDTILQNPSDENNLYLVCSNESNKAFCNEPKRHNGEGSAPTEITPHEENKKYMEKKEERACGKFLPPSLPHQLFKFDGKKIIQDLKNESSPVLNTRCQKNGKGVFKQNFENSVCHQAIYSNILDNINRLNQEKCEDKNLPVGLENIREMYNDVIYESDKNFKPKRKNCQSPSSSDYENGNGNVSSHPKFTCSYNTAYKENKFVQNLSVNSSQEEFKRIYSTPPLPLPPPLQPPFFLNRNHLDNYDKISATSSSGNGNHPSELERPSSKQDFISLAEYMKNKNISPPCYEIAKMYSTKAALFESNRVDHINSNSYHLDLKNQNY